MKKYFAIAFVLLVVLLLVVRKQTEPDTFKAMQRPPTPVEVAKPQPTATPSVESKGASPQVASALTPEKLEQLRSKAKMAMASGYTAQRALQAEWDRFTSDLTGAGWEPTDPELNYKMGFISAFDAPPIEGFEENPARFSTDAYVNQETSGSSQKIRYTTAAEKIRLADFARYCERGCVASKDSFEMLVVMPLDDQGHVDVWTINDKKEIKQVVDGTATK